MIDKTDIGHRGRHKKDKKKGLSMIDRTARNLLSTNIRRLATGQITNDEFEELLIAKCDDKAIEELQNASGMLYSDIRSYKLTGADMLEPEDQTTVARWILFLQTDREYEWPKHPCEGMVRLLAGLISLGRIPKYYDQIWKRNGDFAVWPFLRRKDFEQSLKHPRYLSQIESS